MTLTSLALAAALLAAPAPGTQSRTEILNEIDARWQSGLIDTATRHLYRVAAVKRPSLLPDDLRDQLERAAPVSRTSLSRVFIDAFQWVARTGAWDGAVYQLLQPPADLPYVLDSTLWPIRVSYRDQWDQNLAERALQAAEHCWDVEINDYGFYEPPTMDASHLYRIFIDNTGMGGGGYTAPFDYVNDTPWADCYTYIVADPSNGEWGMDGVLAHELNHAMQAAMDCAEVTTFWENTSVYIASRVYSSELWYAVYSMPYFQSQPWRALDYMRQPDSDLYEYGGGLFTLWLADQYPMPDVFPSLAGPRLLRAIWEASMQNGMYNEPDYYDAIEDVLQAQGHDLTMRDVLVDFSEARFFVGSYDDGAHISNAGQFQDAEVTLVAHHDPSDLPLYDQHPASNQQPAPFGANHILIDLSSNDTHDLHLEFDGADDTDWNLRVVTFGEGTTATQDMILDDETQDGSLLLAHGDYDEVLLVVNNLGGRSYDPDARDWPTADYSYTVRAVFPPATLDQLEPNVVEQGQQNVALRLTGSGFEQGPEFFLKFEDSSIQVVSLDDVTPTEIDFTITVPRLTELGPKTLILSNGDGAVARGEGMLEVVAPGAGDAGPGDDNPKDGCGCRGADGAGGASALFLGLALLLGLAWIRRRRG